MILSDGALRGERTSSTQVHLCTSPAGCRVVNKASSYSYPLSPSALSLCQAQRGSPVFLKRLSSPAWAPQGWDSSLINAVFAASSTPSSTEQTLANVCRNFIWLSQDVGQGKDYHSHFIDEETKI